MKETIVATVFGLVFAFAGCVEDPKSNLSDEEIAWLEEKESKLGPAPFSPENPIFENHSSAIPDYWQHSAHDPDSIEIVEWGMIETVSPKGTEFWKVRVRFRGKNPMGALVVKEGDFFVLHDNVLAFYPAD